ncbi:MAG: hypothetical protein ACTSRP_26815 [Candidatus Helarchaeota archaeon]
MEKGTIRGFICEPKIYEYENQRFTYSHLDGPWPVRKDNNKPYKRVGNKFWDLYSKFCNLSEGEQEKYYVAGGCIPFTASFIQDT